MGMIGKQIYISEDLNNLLNASFGEGKISANIERVLRLYLSNKDNEVKAQYTELEKQVKIFNALFPEWELKLKLAMKEKAPEPPEEKKKIPCQGVV